MGFAKKFSGPAVLILSVALLVLTAGCATPPKQPASGFLGDYQRLKQDPQDMSMWWWAKPGVKWDKYQKLMLDPVEVRIDPQRAQRELNPQETRRLAEAFRNVTERTLAGVYPVVAGPGPGVMRIRAALTNLVPVNPVKNIMSTAILMMPVDLGEAALEVRFSDSMTGELLAELSDSKAASHIGLNQGWRRWSHVEDAFGAWASELRDAMDDIHGR